MADTASSSRTSYDEVPYESFPFPQTHPDRLATLAHLFGLAPPALRRCRVLELGCAAGGNLIPMALAMPEAEFVGVDLSAVQVAEGVAAIEALGLTNIRLGAISITAVDEGFGSFDYILAHGVYSWVPDVVQDKILAICAHQLSENGIAYVSYNTLPGWRMRGMIRDLMRYHAMPFEEPARRVDQARAILDFLAKWVPTGNNAYGMLLKSETEGLRRQPDHYILHEHLEDINEPLYFHEFAARAAGHRLQYLAEADFGTMLTSNFPREVDDTVRRIAPDVIRQEQFMDFLRNRSFRQTLLVHQGQTVNRSLTPERVTDLWVASALQPTATHPDLPGDAEEAFRAPHGGMLKTPNPVTKAAIIVLSRKWPAALSFGRLLDDALTLLAPSGRAAAPAGLTPANTLASDLLQCYAAGLTPANTLASDLLQCYAAGLIELHATPSPFVTRVSPCPAASALARWQAARGLTQITNLRHEIISVDQHLGRLLQLLNGKRDRNAVYRSVTDWALSEPTNKGRKRQELVAPVREKVDRALAQLARAALLVT